MIIAKAEGKKLTLNIDTEIGEDSFFSFFEDDDEEKVENEVKTGKDLKKILDSNKDASLIDIYINSLGGNVFEALSIYNTLKRTRAYRRVFIDGIAASAASVIAMAGNAVYMPKSSMMMIHNAWTVAQGNAKELRKTADDLDICNSVMSEAYMEKFKGTEDELKKLLDDESFLTADQCLEYGLCTKITDNMDEETEGNAQASMKKYKNRVSDTLKRREEIQEMLNKLEAETHKEPETVKDANETSVNSTGFSDAETVKDGSAVNEVEDKADAEPEAPKLNELEKFFGGIKR